MNDLHLIPGKPTECKALSYCPECEHLLQCAEDDSAWTGDTLEEVRTLSFVSALVATEGCSKEDEELFIRTFRIHIVAERGECTSADTEWVKNALKVRCQQNEIIKAKTKNNTNKEDMLNKVYKSIIDNEAKQLIRSAVRKCVKTLQSFKRESGMLQSDDVLENIWDEICVQVQAQYSAMWELYEDLIHSIIEQTLQKFNDNQLLILWLQTDEGWDWQYDYEHEIVPKEPFDDNGFPESFDILNIRTFVFNEIISYAEDHHNKRIDKYLYIQELSDQENESRFGESVEIHDCDECVHTNEEHTQRVKETMKAYYLKLETDVAFRKEHEENMKILDKLFILSGDCED